MNPWSPLKRRKTSKMAVFTDQLRRLVSQGVPEVEALEVLLRDMPAGRLKRVIGVVSGRLKSGSPLCVSLSGFPRYFPDGYISIVEAGEKAGDLPRALELASAYVKKRDISRQRLLLGIILPLMTTIICFSVMRLLQLWLLPDLQEMLAGYAYEAPAPSLPPQPLRLFDAAIVGFASLIVPLLLFFFAVLYYPAAKSVVLYRFCNLLQIALRARLPLEECHRLSRKVSPTRPFRRAVERLFKKLYNGESLTNAFATTSYFRGELSWMIASGESRGDVPGALSNAADFYDVRADSKLSLLFNIAPPVITVAIAIPVAMLGVSLFRFLRWMLDVTYKAIP